MKKIVTIIVIIGIIIGNPVSNNLIIHAKMNQKYTGTYEENLQPQIIIDRYYIKSGNVLPGKTFTVGVVLKNTSRKNNAYNILLTYVSKENMIYPVNEEANQKYIEKIQPNETKEIEINLDTKDEIEGVIADLELEIKYQDSNRNNLSNVSTIQVPIEKEPELVINNISMNNETKAGSKTLLNVKYSNNGIEKIKDLVMKLEGDFDEKQVEVNLGNLSPMENKYLDYYVIFQKCGIQNLKVTFQYTDSNGELHELSNDEFKFKVNVAESTKEPNAMNETTENSAGLNKIKSVIKILIVAVVTVIALLFMKKKSRG